MRLGLSSEEDRRRPCPPERLGTSVGDETPVGSKPFQPWKVPRGKWQGPVRRVRGKWVAGKDLWEPVGVRRSQPHAEHHLKNASGGGDSASQAPRQEKARILTCRVFNLSVSPFGPIFLIYPELITSHGLPVPPRLTEPKEVGVAAAQKGRRKVA